MIWSGAEYRGRGRATRWLGRCDLSHARIERMQPINRWNPERPFAQRGARQVVFDSVTTGNLAGMDLWLDGLEGEIEVSTNLGAIRRTLAELGAAPEPVELGGLARKIAVSRLPDGPLRSDMDTAREIALYADLDTPLWVRATLEDGHQAWSSPILHHSWRRPMSDGLVLSRRIRRTPYTSRVEAAGVTGYSRLQPHAPAEILRADGPGKLPAPA